MSKATKWIERQREVEAARPPDLLSVPHDAGHVGARLLDDGRCRITTGGQSTVFLMADAAVTVARWILDTFGEPE